MGNFSKAVSDALSSAEQKNEELTHEIGSLEFQDKNSFKAPPKEWIDHRLTTLKETLAKDTVASSFVLKELLGEITLEPVTEKELTPQDIIEGKEIASPAHGVPGRDRNDDEGKMGHTLKGDSPIQPENDALGQSPFKPFKPYYIAHTKIQTLALLDEETKGSNWYHWRCVLDFVRTHFKPTAVIANPAKRGEAI